MHFIAVLFFFLLAALILELFKDPNRWYGDMLCLDCGYRWTSRKSSPPARCPNCSGRYLHAVTKNQPSPATLPSVATPSVPQRKVLLPSRPELVTEKTDSLSSVDRQRDNHKKLEKILSYRDISLEEKAYFLVAFTRNADATNLMHRLKVTESQAQELLEYLERVGHVTAPDEMGERLVLVQEPP